MRDLVFADKSKTSIDLRRAEIMIRIRELACLIMLTSTLTLSSAVIAGERVIYAVAAPTVSTGHAAQSSIPLTAGFWEEEGLDVEFISLSGGTAGVQQVGSR